MRSFVICVTNSLRYIKQLLCAGQEVRMWEKKQTVGNVKERDSVFNVGVD